MKYLLFILSFSTVTAWSKPLVLVSYFDKFGKASFNNSENVARAVEKTLNTDSSAVTIKLCGLETKYDVAYAQLEECIKQLDQQPAMIIGLGETGCNVKIEMAAKNLDKTERDPDNAGVRRNNSVIIPEATPHLGLTYPLDQMYCGLDPQDRKNILVSTFAGTFVCNNTAFQLSHYYSEIPNGFIHVPSNNCKDLQVLTAEASRKIAVMISSAVKGDLVSSRLPVTKDEIRAKRAEWADKDACRSEFYRKARGVDEKKWGIF